MFGFRAYFYHKAPHPTDDSHLSSHLLFATSKAHPSKKKKKAVIADKLSIGENKFSILRLCGVCSRYLFIPPKEKKQTFVDLPFSMVFCTWGVFDG